MRPVSYPFVGFLLLKNCRFCGTLEEIIESEGGNGLHKRKLLIAESSPEVADALTDLFRGSCQVRCCSQGDEARQLLSRFRPDVLILDLMLPGYDGLSLLQWAREQEFCPQVLATSRFFSDYVVETAQTLGVRYLMRKPCSVSAMAARIRDLLEKDMPEVRRGPETDIGGLLRVLGIPGKLRGCTYLHHAVPLYARDPLQSITKVLYPDVAKRCGCEPSHVERSIRSAIEAGWKRRDENIWRLYFPADDTGAVSKPTNGAFIARLAQSLQSAEIVQNMPKKNGNVRE